MIFIHGGAYQYGSAEEYQPHVLLNEDIVLVVIQYRLGVLGEPPGRGRLVAIVLKCVSSL